MVFYREKESDRPPLTLILPHLYLGAETDVTQDCLSSQGISYVLSVSRCCPQPAFLPQSQYFRVPIDDSLRDELLPWIPEALQFIDGARSLGCSVLVHCAAGVSRSPALTVAYVMYRLGLDLDDAYRFVKERRPSISPNFNFLGQLQFFQGTLTQKGCKANQNAQLAEGPDSCLHSTNEVISNDSCLPVSANQDTAIPVAKDNLFVSKGDSEEIKVYPDCENPGHITDNLNQDCFYLDCTDRCEPKTAGLTQNSKQDKENLTELSLSDKIRTLTLTLNQREMHSAPGVVNQTQNSIMKSHSKPMQKPTKLQIPTEATSVSDKRKSLTLSLTTLGPNSQVHKKRMPEIDDGNSSNAQDQTNSSKTDHKRETETPGSTNGQNKKSPPNVLSLPTGRPQREPCRPHGEKTPQKRERKSTSKTRRKEEKESHRHSGTNPEGESFCRSNNKKVETKHWCNSTYQHQLAPDSHCASAVEAVEGIDMKQLPLSPINMTVNKFLDWGGKILLGALLGPRIKVGQAALPYRC